MATLAETSPGFVLERNDYEARKIALKMEESGSCGGSHLSEILNTAAMNNGSLTASMTGIVAVNLTKGAKILPCFYEFVDFNFAVNSHCNQNMFKAAYLLKNVVVAITLFYLLYMFPSFLKAADEDK